MQGEALMRVGSLLGQIDRWVESHSVDSNVPQAMSGTDAGKASMVAGSNVLMQLRGLHVLSEEAWRIGGIYLLIDGLEVVYVGQSDGIAGRVSTHVREGAKIFSEVRMLPVAARFRDDVETALITIFRPVYNKALAAGLVGTRFRYRPTRAWAFGALREAGIISDELEEKS